MRKAPAFAGALLLVISRIKRFVATHGWIATARSGFMLTVSLSILSNALKSLEFIVPRADSSLIPEAGSVSFRIPYVLVI